MEMEKKCELKRKVARTCYVLLVFIVIWGLALAYG